jgi:hypothetical protein
VTQEAVEKIAVTSNSEEAGKQAAVAGAAILDIAVTIGLPEEGVAEKTLSRDLATGETGAYKYGASSGRITATGTSSRATR